MARFATGKKSKALCDRCGFKYPYLSLKTEWNGLRVCPECFEVKHPQLTPKSVFDAQEIYQPRPGTNSREDIRILMRHGVTGTFFVAANDQEVPVNWPEVSGVEIASALGAEYLTATIFETGVAITSAVGSIATGPAVTGVAITSALGNEGITIDNGGLWGDPQ